MAGKNKKARTYARHRVLNRKGKEKLNESDSTYFLKLVLCLILGMVWIKLGSPLAAGPFEIRAVPIGLLVGLFIVSRFEKFQYDRKIWYALLVLVAIAGLFLPTNIMI